MSSSVDQIKSKIDIVSLVSSYIKLDKAGGNFKGRCPFHNEKTPSFFVSPDRGNYYCFGCHAKGDIFTFVQEFEGLDFVGSLKVLADRAGVELEKYSKGDKTEKEKLHSVLEQAVFFYQKKLSENKLALEYLKNRGVTDTTIKDFRIGFAPAEWRELYEYLLSRDVTEKDMLQVGLVKKKEAGESRAYDTFRGRIMFPIADSSGRIVAFSGRILTPDEKSPKYLNSPETSLFNKSEILFGFDKAKKDIRLKDYSILVEGQMDLIMMHQAGMTNTVASSGTALSENHLIKLRRLSNRIIMAFDGDSAGFSASDRSSNIALSLGMELKIADLPEGKDPADLVKDNPESLRECFKQTKHIIDYLTDKLVARGLEPRELGQEIKKHILPRIALLPSTIEQSHFVKNIAKKAFIKEEALWGDLNVPVPTLSRHLQYRVPESSPPHKRLEQIERKVVGILFWQEGKNVEIEKKVKKILGEKFEELQKKFEKEKEALIFETENYYNDKNNLGADIKELLLGLEEEYLKKERDEVRNKLQRAEQSGSDLEIEKYKKNYHLISQQIDKIKNKNEE